ncbi:MAG: Ppx/GppA family phosphatase [Bacteroidetes bacterium]|nr:Ppx/GppA family phosphatase [Bacteroidota bacterium]
MRLASIDIGTNTVLLLIADTNGSLKTVYEDQKIIRLGKSVDADRCIGLDGFQKLVNVLTAYREPIQQYGCAHTIVAATSALRDAGNRDEFIDRVCQATGFRIAVLSGDEEAQTTFFGGRMVLPQEEQLAETFLIDIGGGSTEYIVGNGSRIHKKTSLDIGSVRLTERFIKHDPVVFEEEDILRNFIRTCLSEKLSDFSVPEGAVAIGVAGTVTTAATMAMSLTGYDWKKVNGYVLSTETVDRLIFDLRSKNLEGRQNIQGLHPDRADIIFAGLIILRESMAYFGFDDIVTSHFGLRHGLIHGYLLQSSKSEL